MLLLKFITWITCRLSANHGPRKRQQDKGLWSEDLERERGLADTAWSAVDVDLRQRTSTAELPLSLVSTLMSSPGQTGIMFSTCPSVRPSVRSSVNKILWKWHDEHKWSDFDANMHK